MGGGKLHDVRKWCACGLVCRSRGGQSPVLPPFIPGPWPLEQQGGMNAGPLSLDTLYDENNTDGMRSSLAPSIFSARAASAAHLKDEQIAWTRRQNLPEEYAPRLWLSLQSTAICSEAKNILTPAFSDFVSILSPAWNWWRWVLSFAN